MYRFATLTLAADEEEEGWHCWLVRRMDGVRLAWLQLADWLASWSTLFADSCTIYADPCMLLLRQQLDWWRCSTHKREAAAAAAEDDDKDQEEKHSQT